MITPLQPKPKYPTNPFDSMKRYIGKALENRENYFAGLDEAGREYGQSSTPYTTAPTAEAARQMFRASPVAKDFISDNQWHMKQAMMFGVASIASSLLAISRDVYMMRKMMEDDRKTSMSLPTPRKGR